MARLMNDLREMFTDRDYLRRLGKLALPMALASIMSSSLQIIDTLMIAALGDVAVAATGMANRFTYLFSSVIAGFSSGASVFGAQFWGDQNPQGLRRTLTLSLLLLLPCAAVFCLIAVFAPQWVMAIFSSDPAVIEEGCIYLRLIGPAYLFQSLAAMLAAILKATERPSIAVTASTAGILSNVFLNYVMIFGKLGLPAMGVKGAAIATLIAAAIEAGVISILAQKRKAPVTLRRLALPTRAFTGQFLKVSLPVLLNDVVWTLGIVGMAWVYSTMGTAAAAAASVYETIKAFVVVCCIAVGGAGGILLGIELGAGRIENAEKYAKRILIGGILVALCVIPVMLIAVDPLLGLYGEMSAEALSGLRGMLITLAVFFWIKMTAYNLICGISRAGGDSFLPGLYDIFAHCVVAFSLVFITGYLLKWPLTQVFPLTFVGDVVAVALCYHRYRKGYWKHKLS